MLSFREPRYDDKEHDNCGNTTIAVLEIDNITIPLCKDCLQNLREDITSYDNIKFCHRCEHFKGSKSGPVHYGGSCTCDQEVEEKDYGFVNCVDYFSICTNGKFEHI